MSAEEDVQDCGRRDAVRGTAPAMSPQENHVFRPGAPCPAPARFHPGHLRLVHPNRMATCQSAVYAHRSTQALRLGRSLQEAACGERLVVRATGEQATTPAASLDGPFGALGQCHTKSGRAHLRRGRHRRAANDRCACGMHQPRRGFRRCGGRVVSRRRIIPRHPTPATQNRNCFSVDQPSRGRRVLGKASQHQRTYAS